MFKLEIETANAAFEGDPTEEIALILDGLLDRLRYTDYRTGSLFDSNGNRVGSWTLATDDEEA